jgi:hypothetical protein
MTQTTKDPSVGGLIRWFLVLFFVWLALPARWTDRLLYSMVYHINSDQIHRSDRPTDCDFMRAPLGGKGCRYTKLVTAYNTAGDAVGGDNAPKYSTNAYNNTLVSYDEGKTWQLLGAARPDSTVTRVEIYWVKETE